MKILGVIPARYKSSRFPGKPLALIGGKPMIYRVYESAKGASCLDQLVVATDDDRIAQACKQLDVPYVMTLDTHFTGTDRVAEVASKVHADLYVNIQGDEPFIQPSMVDAAVESLKDLSDPQKPIATCLCSRIDNIDDVLDTTIIKIVKAPDGHALYMSRQPIPFPRSRAGVLFFKQVCIYGFTPAALCFFAQSDPMPMERTEGIEFLRFLENGIEVLMVEVEGETLSVDTPSDLELANQEFERRKRRDVASRI